MRALPCGGGVLIHRKIVGTDIWKNPVLYQLWSLLIMEAWFKPGYKQWRGKSFLLGRGQAWITMRYLEEQLGVHRNTIHRLLKYLEETGRIRLGQMGLKSGTLVTILKYDENQPELKTLGTPKAEKRDYDNKREKKNSKKRIESCGRPAGPAVPADLPAPAMPQRSIMLPTAQRVEACSASESTTPASPPQEPESHVSPPESASATPPAASVGMGGGDGVVPIAPEPIAPARPEVAIQAGPAKPAQRERKTSPEGKTMPKDPGSGLYIPTAEESVERERKTWENPEAKSALKNSRALIAEYVRLIQEGKTEEAKRVPIQRGGQHEKTPSAGDAHRVSDDRHEPRASGFSVPQSGALGARQAGGATPIRNAVVGVLAQTRQGENFREKSTWGMN